MRYSTILLGAVLASATVLGSTSRSEALVAAPDALLAAAVDADLAFPVARRGGFAVRGGGVAVRRSGAVAVRRGGAVAVRRGAIVRPGVVRAGRVVGVRRWVRRPWFGTVIGGVALGTIIAVTAVGVAPAAPAENMCWYWTDPSQTRGYWDYCTPPQ